ncbi:MAG TPA: SdpI family protein [Roseateles sp.]|uniref:SdpI family protein n=1 Tax=Roseateles sp. TaxID=1971397 RepID=UPI002EDAFF30
MFERYGTRIQVALIAVMALAGAWAFMQLPAGTQVPVHFNALGEADGWAAAGLGLFMLPLLALGLLGLQWVLPRLDPRGENLRKSGKALATIWLAVTLLLALVQAQVVAMSLGQAGPAPRLPMLLMGGLFVLMGNVLGKLRSNYTVGIRTPWTLANERVWDQTHRFAGKVFVVAGLLLVALSMSPLPPQWQAAAICGTALAAAAVSVLKSYWLWRRQQGGA